MAGIDISQASLLAEKDRLVSSVVALLPGGGHATTIGAVQDLMNRFRDDEGSIPWVRMYDSFPPWQQRCGLLQENWDRNAVPERAKVIFTLNTALGQGGGFSREALGGGKWKSTGADNIGYGVVLTKLYFKRDGCTAFEFHLANDQPRVWVLHRTDYRHCVRDLRHYIEQTSYDHPSIRSSLEAPPPPAPLDVISQHLFSENDSPESGGQNSQADYMSVLNGFRNLL